MFSAVAAGVAVVYFGALSEPCRYVFDRMKERVDTEREQEEEEKQQQTAAGEG